MRPTGHSQVAAARHPDPSAAPRWEKSVLLATGSIVTVVRHPVPYQESTLGQLSRTHSGIGA